jgi:hypothetical protein
VAGRDRVEAGCLPHALGCGIARLPRRRLEIALAGHVHALDEQLQAQRAAELRAVALVLSGRIAQAMVHVQDLQALGPECLQQRVDQADRVRAAREQRQHPLAGVQGARLGDRVGDFPVDGHMSYSSAWPKGPKRCEMDGSSLAARGRLRSALALAALAVATTLGALMSGGPTTGLADDPPDSVPGQLIVAFKPTATDKQEQKAVDRVDATVEQRIESIDGAPRQRRPRRDRRRRGRAHAPARGPVRGAQLRPARA